MKLKHHARYYLPGSFFAEHESRELSDRSADAALARATQRARLQRSVGLP